MLNRKLAVLLCQVLFLTIPICGNATIHLQDGKTNYPFYVGVTGGYGSTTWGQLVPADGNAALSFSTPVRVDEGGGLWGVYGGYEVSPYFAFEGGYSHYSNATLFFDPFSLFTFDYNGLTEFTSHIESVFIVAKFMVFIPCTPVRVFSGAGIAGVHRYDEVLNKWRASPTFELGFNYNITPRFMAELGTDYTAGYGQSEIDPAEHFIPFLYSTFLRLALRF